MKKNLMTLLAVALIVPAVSFAAPGFNHPVNGGFNHPSNGGGVAVHPGHSNNHGSSYNNGGYNNGGYNNGGYNNGGYNNGGYNNGGYNNGGYNNGGHNNGGYNNNHNHGHPGYNPGNNHGNNGGHFSPVNAKIRMVHRDIKRAFQDAENAFYPFLMNGKDHRKMGFALRKIAFEISNMMSLVGPRFKDNLREVGMKIEKAKFALFSENDAHKANRIIKRAEKQYDDIADILVR